MRLTSVDLPTLGRPTTASTGCASAASSASSAASICASSAANSVSSDQVPSISPTLSNSSIMTQFPLYRAESVFGTPVVQSLHERRELAAQLLGALVEPGFPGSDLRRKRLTHEDVH